MDKYIFIAILLIALDCYFASFFPSLLLLSSLDLLTILMLCLDCFFFFLMCESVSVFGLWFPLDLGMSTYVCAKWFGVAVFLFSHAFSVFCVCLLFFSCLLVLILYLSMGDFSTFILFLSLPSEFSHLKFFFFLIVAFSFLLREIPLVVVVEML